MDKQKRLGVFFDFDRTLAVLPVNWSGLRAKLKEVYSEKGLNLSFRPLLQDILKGDAELQKKAVRLLSEVELDAANKCFFEAKTKRLVERLSQRVVLAIVSSNSSSSVKKALEVNGVENFFSQVAGRDNCAKFKPDAEPVLKAAASLNLHPENVFFVGNSSDDVEAANAAGCRSVLLSSAPLGGFADKADFIISDLSEVETVLQSDFIADFYSKKAVELPELENTYLSKNLLRRRLYASRSDCVFNALRTYLATGKKVLDVGCGAGWYLKKISGYDVLCYGVDVSQGYVEQAKKFTNGKVKVVKASALELPFEKGSFDVVLMTEVVEHTVSPLKALRECFRVLKKGGFLIVTAPNSFSVLEQIPKIKAGLNKRRFEHLCGFTSFSFKKTIENAGFSVIDESYCGYLFVPFGLSKLGTGLKNVLDFVEGAFSKIPLLKKTGWTMVFVCAKKQV
ncbi:MAG: HAD-IA family hydrolase [Candidatus Micrarchaeia archaeon]